MNIPRPNLISQLFSFVRSGNALLIGDPGIGKSWAMRELKNFAVRQNIPVELIAIDSIYAEDEAELNAYVGWPSNLVEYLRAHPATAANKGLLLFDAFDAARSDKKRNLFLRLIRRCLTELRTEWSIMVSVRTFDAQKSRELIHLFPAMGSPVARQISIPFLNDDEIAVALGNNTALKTLFDRCSVELKEVLRNPFNLWLLEQISSANSEADMSGFHTATQLLSLFWRYRVHEEGTREQNEFLLKRVADQQVKTKQLVSLRGDVYSPEVDAAWVRMFSSGILVEDRTTKNGVKFSHNILFDFAVARLLISDEPRELGVFLVEDPARPLFLRPSLVYHFENQFHDRPRRFWQNFFEACASEHPALTAVTRLILPSVLVTEARTLLDLEPLLLSLRRNDVKAIRPFGYLLQGIRAVDFSAKNPEAQRKYDLWAELLVSGSDSMNDAFAWDFGLVNEQVLAFAEKHNRQDLVGKCGKVARVIFEWNWRQKGESLNQWNYRLSSVWGIPQTCRSFSTAPDESRAVLNRVLELLNQPGFPIDCVYAICTNIVPVIAADPVFTGKIYRTVFGYQEQSEEQTQMGGLVLPMLSNRRQDYDMCHYNLIKSFPDFLRLASTDAVSAGVDLLEGIILAKHVVPYLKPNVRWSDLFEFFQFRGKRAQYIQDISHVWDSGSYPDQELQIANSIERHLIDLANNNAVQRFEADVEVYVQHARLAFFWKRLLEAGSQQPGFFASYLHSLCVAKPVMTGSDTIFALGKFIESAFVNWNLSQRLAIEKAVVALAPTASNAGDEQKWLSHARDRLLVSIPSKLLQTEGGRALREALDKAERPTRNEPLITFESETRPFTAEDFLKERGAAVEAPENARILEATNRLQVLRSRADKKPVTTEDVTEYVKAMKELETLLTETNDADERVLSHAMTELSSLAVLVVRNPKIIVDDQRRFLCRILLDAAKHPDPRPDEEHDLQWKHATWSPWPRNNAAQGLPWILLADENNNEGKEAIHKLSEDPVPSVRFLVALELFRIQKGNAELMTRILSRRVSAERNMTVVDGLCTSLQHTLHLDSSRALVHELYERMKEDKEQYNYHEDVISMIVDILVTDRELWAKEIFHSWEEDILEHSRNAQLASKRLSDYLRPTINEDLFAPALYFEGTLVQAALSVLLHLQEVPPAELTGQIPKSAQRLYRLLDHIIVRLYFAFDFDGTGRGRREIIPTDLQRRTFFRHITPLLKRVVDFANDPNGWLLAPTAHHFMQLLAGAVDYDVNEVLRFAILVARGSEKSRYPFDSLAIKEVVELVEKILADYRGDIRDAESFKNLVALLDIFAAAGWPEALRLVWRLDEVYR